MSQIPTFFYMPPEVEIIELMIREKLLQTSENISNQSPEVEVIELKSREKFVQTSGNISSSEEEISEAELKEPTIQKGPDQKPKTPHDVIKIKLGVLGMSAAGKTTFLRQSGIIPSNGENRATSIDVYPDTEIQINGRRIICTDVIDIGGSASFAEMMTHEWVNTKDLLVFIFDGNSFMTDENYRLDVSDRLNGYYQEVRNAGRDSSHDVIIASHSDIYQGNDMIGDIRNIINNEDYFRLFPHFYSCKLSDRSSVRNLVQNIFI